MKKRKIDLTTGPIMKKLLVYVAPIVLSNLLQSLYNAADRMVVGRFAENGTAALAAVGATGSATTMLLCLFSGLSLGTNIICSNLRGARNMTDLRKTMGSAPLLALICGISIMLVGVLACRPILVMMSAPTDILDQAVLYMRIYFLGAPASILYNFGSATLRSNGDTKRPMLILALSGLVNVALNLVLVIGFHLDVAGVAIATIASQYLSAFQIWRIVFDPKDEYKLTFKELKLHKRQVWTIIKVGVPCGLNGIVFSLSSMVMQSTVNTFGPVVIAGNVASDSVTNLLYQVLAGFYMAVISFTGQNYGARKLKRIDRGLGMALMLGCGSVMVLGACTVIFHTPVLSLFDSDPDVIAAGSGKLTVLSNSNVLYGVSEILMGALRGMKKTAVPTAINVGGVCLFRVVWILVFFPLNPTLNMLYACFPISYAVSGAGMLIFYLICRHNLLQETKTATA